MKLKYYAKSPVFGRERNFEQTIEMTEDIRGIESQVVNIYPELSYETFEGFGGAVTEAAGYIYSLMNDEQKKKVIETYFSPEKMNYRLVRVHMDSCDFSLGLYEAMSNSEDTELKSFSFERTEKYILPMLEDAKKTAGENLKLMLTPWSPPAFMKTNGKRTGGGKLKPEYRKLWAEYICRYIREFQNRGFEVQRISIQNEPKAVQTWDSCLFTAEEEKSFLRDFLYPTMKSHGFENIEVFIWDHNKERIYERVRDTVDEETREMVSGAAFHWYSGDHFEGLELVRRLYPELKLIMSESCLEYSIFDEKNIESVTNKLCHEIIGDLNHGMCAFYDWNLLLDEKGGPNHVGNYCHAPFLYDVEKKKLLPQKTQEQYEMFSHFICPGSVRVQTTKFTEQIDTVAYRTPDGRIVLILLNKGKELEAVNIRLGKMVGSLLLPAGILAACEIEM
ncbi:MULTISPECIES: glycoside hydrolase family 30 beta sandwich domain-containing protein [Clostridia]|uniref:glycoside hydrolase family 30 protein n=1 Tax=Clostridia TaxID=186801 RepID=UPI000E485A6E|nr:MULTISPECIES: glycoside hydrolase family 30 beta sandwich domain-containing protein [Clostridia]MBT9836797.1 glucosylceramidase [Blautia sp. MCC270]RHR70625.1 glucosylceramidase [Ruminococcus sp. AF17-12]